jgi:ribosomal protein S18 acetylase RimI-like enzyme
MSGLTKTPPSLVIRRMRPDEHEAIQEAVIDSFEPITWYKKLEAEIGPLAGTGWRDRWRKKLRTAFATETILLGEADGRVVAYAGGTYDAEARLAFLDILAVFKGNQGNGFGRAMLRGFMANMKQRGARYCHLDCLTDNDGANELYRTEGFFKAASSHHWFIDMS